MRDFITHMGSEGCTGKPEHTQRTRLHVAMLPADTGMWVTDGPGPVAGQLLSTLWDYQPGVASMERAILCKMSGSIPCKQSEGLGADWRLLVLPGQLQQLHVFHVMMCHGLSLP